MNQVIALNLPFPVRYRLTLSFRIFYLIIPLAILLLGFYVFQITEIVSESYQIQQYQRGINELTAETKSLEINSASLNSLASIDGRIQALGFEPVGKIDYIQILTSSAMTKK